MSVNEEWSEYTTLKIQPHCHHRGTEGPAMTLPNSLCVLCASVVKTPSGNGNVRLIWNNIYFR
jgi:hypothetical protein